MVPDDSRIPLLQVTRNRGGLLFGVSWSHDHSWPFRTTHFYLGMWVLTHRTRGRNDRP